MGIARKIGDCCGIDRCVRRDPKLDRIFIEVSSEEVLKPRRNI
jgi:hypothetical protein